MELPEAISTRHYAFQAASTVPEEATRLDDLHEGIREYLGGGLSFAPLEDMQPRDILEIGSGSGAWAIQAAKAFPLACVTAIDISPMPERPLPNNLRFQQVDITKPLPFHTRSFDIVHARLVMMHVRNGEDVINHAATLVKPGGWILIEEPDDENMRNGELPIGPGIRAFLDGWNALLRSRGADPSIGKRLRSILEESGLFAKVNVKKVTIPISGKGPDPAENQLGRTWMTVSKRVARDLPQRFAAAGITPEITRRHLAELEDPDNSITTDLYFTWSLRK